MQGRDVHHVDLERLALRSGQARTMSLRLRPPVPVVGGVRYPLEDTETEALLSVSRTTSGFALKLVAEVALTGPCARCLEPSGLRVPILAREVDQDGSEDPELSSPYVDDRVLDLAAWLHDAITLALPEKVLCRPDCAGICETCGRVLNDLEPGSHSHEKPPDPRFAKLRELLD